MLNVFKSQLAENDFVQIFRYLDDLNPSLANRVSDQFESMLELLARQPKLGKIVTIFAQVFVRSLSIDTFYSFVPIVRSSKSYVSYTDRVTSIERFTNRITIDADTESIFSARSSR